MIDTTSCATNGVKLPNGCQTQQAIIKTFKEQLTALWVRLMVRCIPTNCPSPDIYLQSNAVKGKVSLTCDAWQVSNVDGYFAVTGSWIEEEKNTGQWELKTALLGFTQLNNAHNGVRLGQALFKVISWAGIAHKVSHSCIVLSQNNDMDHTIIDWTCNL